MKRYITVLRSKLFYITILLSLPLFLVAQVDNRTTAFDIGQGRKFILTEEWEEGRMDTFKLKYVFLRKSDKTVFTLNYYPKTKTDFYSENKTDFQLVEEYYLWDAKYWDETDEGHRVEDKNTEKLYIAGIRVSPEHKRENYFLKGINGDFLIDIQVVSGILSMEDQLKLIVDTYLMNK